MNRVSIMGATTGGQGPGGGLDPPPQFGRTLLVGVTDCAKIGLHFFLEKGSNTSDQGIESPPNVESAVASVVCMAMRRSNAAE